MFLQHRRIAQQTAVLKGAAQNPKREILIPGRTLFVVSSNFLVEIHVSPRSCTKCTQMSCARSSEMDQQCSERCASSMFPELATSFLASSPRRSPPTHATSPRLSRLSRSVRNSAAATTNRHVLDCCCYCCLLLLPLVRNQRRKTTTTTTKRQQQHEKRPTNTCTTTPTRRQQ